MKKSIVLGLTAICCFPFSVFAQSTLGVQQVPIIREDSPGPEFQESSQALPDLSPFFEVREDRDDGLLLKGLKVSTSDPLPAELTTCELVGVARELVTGVGVPGGGACPHVRGSDLRIHERA